MVSPAAVNQLRPSLSVPAGPNVPVARSRNETERHRPSRIEDTHDRFHAARTVLMGRMNRVLRRRNEDGVLEMRVVKPISGEVVTQPGYDVLAERYASMFPSAYQTSIERHAVAAFVERIHGEGCVVDVGCGVGHVTADLARRGLDAMGCDPSPAMLGIARNTYPDLTFIDTDATLALVTEPMAAIVARFSLIHIPPEGLNAVFERWAGLLRPNSPVLIASQSTDVPGPAAPFDHAVAPAWRWHPDEMSRVLAENGFTEQWRIVNRPDAVHRFPGLHLLAYRR